jgi:hypothetical protein
MEAMLDRLQRIRLDVLTDVVRQDQQRSSLIITDWAVQPLSDKGIINPGGLWALDGHARDAHGSYAWSLVIKVLRRPQRVLSPSDPWYWKREVRLPVPTSGANPCSALLPCRRAPRCRMVMDGARAAVQQCSLDTGRLSPRCP